MAPSDEENKHMKTRDDANPFIAFRRFADDQMSSVMNGIFSISSLFASPSTSPRRSGQDYEKWLQEARASPQPSTREVEAGRIMGVYTKSYGQGQHANQGNSQEPASDDDCGPLKCPYRTDEQETPRQEKAGPNICFVDDTTRSFLSLAALGLGFPGNILTAPVHGGQLPSVPIAYLLYSPYSPVRLEQQPYLCDHGAKWREAFEDLLAVQNGWKLPPRYSQRIPTSSVDWVRGMIDLAMYRREEGCEQLSSTAGKTSRALKQDPALLSRFTSTRSATNDADEDDDVDCDDLDEVVDAYITEMDVYDRIFGSQQRSSSGLTGAAARSFAHLQHESSPIDTDSGAPSILSTLTTTERTTLRDGSIYTKVVLKKRFSDGREESTETVHHQNAVDPAQDAASNSIRDMETRKAGKEKETKEKSPSGWFWS